MIGYFVWCWNDEEWLETCLNTFRVTTDNILLVGILNASTDSSKDIYDKYCDKVAALYPSQSMSACVNTGYTILYQAGCDYLGWIHPDMKFEQRGWVDVLKKTLDTYPEIGKISPENSKHPSGENYIYGGAEAGNLIRRSSWISVGPYDEAYIGCGGYEDWDIQRRFIARGQGNCITPAAQVWHQHAGTRTKIDHGLRHVQWTANQKVYYDKWHTYENAMLPEGWTDLPVVR